MSLRRENTTPPRLYGTPSMRHPRTFTPPQQRTPRVTRRGSLSLLPISAEKKPFSKIKRRNSFSCGNDDLSPTKLDFQSLKRPSILGNKLKLGSKETGAVSNGGEKHGIVVLGAGGVGKTGKQQDLIHLVLPKI